MIQDCGISHPVALASKARKGHVPCHGTVESNPKFAFRSLVRLATTVELEYKNLLQMTRKEPHSSWPGTERVIAEVDGI
jgi:hypothetical protein